MNVLVAGTRPWVGLTFRCPGCGAVVQFEIDDLRAIPRITPKQDRTGRWEVLTQCKWCGTMQTYRQIDADAAGGEAGGFERLEPGPGSSPDSPATCGRRRKGRASGKCAS